MFEKIIASAYYFDGDIDELRIWNTVRMQSEIRNNMYQNLSEIDTSLLAYYPCNQFTGRSLVDHSFNNNIGTLTHMDTNTDWVPSYAELVSNNTFQKSLPFDGVDDYVDLGNIDLANTSFSIEFYARHTQTGQNDMIVSQGSSTDNGGLNIGFNSNNVFMVKLSGELSKISGKSA